MQKKIWAVQPPNKDSASRLAVSLGVSDILAQVLINRKITDSGTAKSFLEPKLNDLIAPEQMPGMAAAVARIKKAVNANEKITIYGDYDVDGITSVAICWKLFSLLGREAEYYVPHRVDEGYGLNDEAIKQIAANGTNLIITVDCGINAIAQAQLAASLGVDLIITDHHQAGPILPRACAIVHPQMNNYPNPESAGAMVAFKLAWAVVNEFKSSERADPPLRRFLLDATTLAALGTIADVVELQGENRTLASFGLKAVAESKLPGIIALIESASLTGQDIDSYHISFRLAPILNASGRMGHARLAVELLTSDAPLRCAKIAEYLAEQNKLRQKCQKNILKQAREKISAGALDHPDRKTIVIADDNWHTGVIGIVASRIVETYMRPAVLINSSDPLAKGSARSVPGFDIYKAFTNCQRHLEGFGGHPMAAGLKLKPENIAAFANAFEEYAEDNLKDRELLSRLDIDGCFEIRNFNHSLINQLGMLQPFGQANPQPVFATNGVRLISPPRRVGTKGDHLQIAVTDNTASVRCIGFGMGPMEKKLLDAEAFNIAYHPQMNHYNGTSTVQFVLSDIRIE